jgi:dihydropteroate synthase
VLPVVEAIADLDAMLSIDTRKPSVAESALDAGADIINDVSGLADAEMRHLAAERDVPVVAMHSFDLPVDPEHRVHYDDVVEDVVDELTERVFLAEKAGLDREQILIDPGLGFGKAAAESFEILGRLGEFEALGCPILVGHSHKSMFSLVGEEGGDCLEATIAGTAVATAKGADVIRVHDAEENLAAVRVVQAAEDPSQFVDE